MKLFRLLVAVIILTVLASSVLATSSLVFKDTATRQQINSLTLTPGQVKNVDLVLRVVENPNEQNRGAVSALNIGGSYQTAALVSAVSINHPALIVGGQAWSNGGLDIFNQNGQQSSYSLRAAVPALNPPPRLGAGDYVLFTFQITGTQAGQGVIGITNPQVDARSFAAGNFPASLPITVQAAAAAPPAADPKAACRATLSCAAPNSNAVCSDFPPYPQPLNRKLCCPSPTACVMGTGAAARCIPFGAIHPTDSSFICGANNDWDRCGPLNNPAYNKHDADPSDAPSIAVCRVSGASGAWAACQEAVPANAALCAGDDQVVNSANRMVVAACTAQRKCEYTCNAGFILQNGACVAQQVPLSCPADQHLVDGACIPLPLNDRVLPQFDGICNNLNDIANDDNTEEEIICTLTADGLKWKWALGGSCDADDDCSTSYCSLNVCGQRPRFVHEDINGDGQFNQADVACLNDAFNLLAKPDCLVNSAMYRSLLENLDLDCSPGRPEIDLNDLMAFISYAQNGQFPDNIDANHDAVPDCTIGGFQDRDHDAIADNVDTCPDVASPDRLDNDGDGVGDICDNCPGRVNPDQADADRDGVGDACPMSAFTVDALNARNYVILDQINIVLQQPIYAQSPAYKRVSLFARGFKGSRATIEEEGEGRGPRQRHNYIIDAVTAENQLFLQGVLAQLREYNSEGLGGDDARIAASQGIRSQRDHVRNDRRGRN